MKKLALILAIFATPAFAQPAQQQSFDELQVQYLAETGQLRQLLGQSQALVLQLRKENAELKAKGEQTPPSDAIGVPSPGGGVQMKMQEPKK